MAQRIDFKHVRTHADFGQVLASYNIELHQDGSKPGQFKATCPFHEDTKPSLKVNTERNIYNCFACDAGGNVIDFVKKMDGIELRPAAAKVAEICGIATTANGTARPVKTGGKKKKAGKSSPPPPPATPETPEDEAADLGGDPYNKVLSFNLNLTLDEDLLTWLESRGILTDAIQTFGLGRASARSKTIGNRLAIPIHNKDGDTVAYCGRYPADEMPDDETPKYVLPKGFRKDLEVFNLHRQPEELPYVVLFESYFSVIRHHEHLNAVSTFGRSISSQQVEMLVNAGIKKAIIVFDGDQPGRDGAATVAGQLAPHMWVRSMTLPDAIKPHRLDWPTLRDLLGNCW